MEISGEEAEHLAADKPRWHQRVAKCTHLTKI